MDDLKFLDHLPRGNATLCVVHAGGGTSTIANLNLETIEKVSPVLAHAFENTALGPKHSIEEMSLDAVVSLLRHVHTSQHYIPEHQLDEQTSLMAHVEIYCLAIIYDIASLKSMAKGRISTELMLATSDAEPPEDLCDALDFIYEHLLNERDLVETLAHYCVYCFLTHKLNEDVTFKALHEKHHQLQQDLCSVVRTNEFEDETAAAIIQLSAETSFPPPAVGTTFGALDQRLASLPSPPTEIAIPLNGLDSENEEKTQLKAEVVKLEKKVEALQQQITADQAEVRRLSAIETNRNFYRDKLAGIAQRDRTMYWDKQHLKATVESQDLTIHDLKRQLEAIWVAKKPGDAAASEVSTRAALSTCEEPCRNGEVGESDQEATFDIEVMFEPSTGGARRGSPFTMSSDSDYDMMETPPKSRTISLDLTESGLRNHPEPGHIYDTLGSDGDISDEDWNICGRSGRGDTGVGNGKRSPFQRSYHQMEETACPPECRKAIHNLTIDLVAANDEVAFLDEYIQSLYEAQATLVRQMDTARLEGGNSRWTIHTLNLQLARLIEQAHQPATDSEWTAAYIQSKQRELYKAYERINELRNQLQSTKAGMDHSRSSEKNIQGAINRLRTLISQHRNDGKSPEQIEWDVQWEAKQQYRSHAEELEYLGDAVEHINSFIDGLTRANGALRHDIESSTAREQEIRAHDTAMQNRCDGLELELEGVYTHVEDLGFQLTCADIARQSVEGDAERKQECCEELLTENKKIKAENESLETKTHFLESILRNGIHGCLGGLPDPENARGSGGDGTVGVQLAEAGAQGPWELDGGNDSVQTSGAAANAVEPPGNELIKNDNLHRGERERLMRGPHEETR